MQDFHSFQHLEVMPREHNCKVSTEKRTRGVTSVTDAARLIALP